MTDLTLTKQYTLSIRLSTDGFTFSIYNPIETEQMPPVTKETDASLPLAANLRSAFRETDFLGLPYKRVNVLMESKRFTTIPLEMFDENQAEQLFYYNFPRQEYEAVCCNLLQRNNLAVVFALDKGVRNFLLEQYPEAHFYAQATPLIACFAEKSLAGNSRKMYAVLHADCIDIFCFERDKLLLNNSLPCTETADRVYYLLYVWKQVEFDQERDELHLSGTLREKEKLLEELRRFVRHVFVMNPIPDNELQAILTLCE